MSSVGSEAYGIELEAGFLIIGFSFLTGIENVSGTTANGSSWNYLTGGAGILHSGFKFGSAPESYTVTLAGGNLRFDSFPTEVTMFIKESGSLATGRQEVIDSISRRTRGVHLPLFDTTDSEYPSEFLDQLYMTAVGDDFQGTQRVVESLNSNLPLSVQDKEFLSKYPFLLTGTAEDRLTRLMRSKKSVDRLSRIMGR